MNARPVTTTPRDRIIEAARRLFMSKGFHSSPMAELAESARVSVGQVYRLFANKSDVISAIIEQKTSAQQHALTAICEQLESGQVTIQAAFEQFVNNALTDQDEGLSFEILAEAHRNPRVADTIHALCDDFRGAIRRLAAVSHPEFGARELDASEELLLACLFGLGHRSLSQPRLSNDETAHYAARMMIGAMEALRPGVQ